MVREHLGDLTQPQVDGFLNLIEQWNESSGPDHRWFAYMLATVWHETARTVQPIREYGGEAYLRSKPYYPYYGRGYVQLTWKANYLHYGIANDPDLALVPKTAAHILFDGMENGVFTGKRLSDYFNARITDAVNARRIVNGLDKAVDIAGYYAVFVTAIQELYPVQSAPDPKQKRRT